MTRRRRAVATLLVLTVAGATTACTRPEGQTEVGAASDSGDATDGDRQPADGAGDDLDQGGFGDLEAVCKEADTSAGRAGGSIGATETGLSDDGIRLGTITDKGSNERPGLTEEMYDAAVAFAAWCNEHGGIQGRDVIIDDLDARLFDYGQRISEACDADFALVGGGGVFDSQGLDRRMECGLPNIPGYVVSPQARVAELQVQPVPNPIYEFQSASYRLLADRDAGRYGILWVNLEGPATVHQQSVEAVEELGYDVVFDEQYRPLGETGWRGFVQEMRDAGVQTFEMIGEPENMVALQGAMQTEGWYPEVIVLEANYFDERYAAEGADSVSDATYIHSSFPTFDMADEAPGMRDYLDLMERYNPDGKVALLGAQAMSAFLLFATAANECGAELSRACVLGRAAAVENWTAGGLHAPQTPGNAVASRCTLMIRVTPDGFDYDEETTQPTDGPYNCDSDNVLELSGDYGVPRPES